MTFLSANEIALIGTGIGLGIVHVLTGPDHLSALATLSAVSDFCKSFCLGVRWGIGHSTGLLLVGIILIIRDYHNNNNNNSNNNDTVDMPEWLGPFCETIVGFFMLFLGVYGFRRAWLKRNRYKYEGRIQLPTSEIEEEGNNNSNKRTDLETTDTIIHDTNNKSSLHHFHPTIMTTICTYHDDDPLETLTDIVSNEYPPRSSLEMEESRGVFGNCCDCRQQGQQNQNYIFNFGRRFSARTMAVFAGIIHGLAGPGGVLGVIPAVQLHDWKLASIYLGSFCIASTLTMGCFASCYGLLSSGIGKKTHLEFQIHCFSSSLSILVGITWLVLLSMGKLEEVFP